MAPFMSMVASALVCIAAYVTVAALARTRASAGLGLLISVALLPLPWFVRGSPPERVLLAFTLGFLLIGAVDFRSGRRPETFARRFTYLLAVTLLIDAMSAVPVRRHLEWRTWGRFLAALVSGAAATGAWIAVTGVQAPFRVPVRLAAALVIVLAVAEATDGCAAIVAAACRRRIAPLHDQPYRSLTVTEFWSRRWNPLGARWFREHTFAPARHLGLIPALFALFAINGAMHVYLIAAAVSARWMLLCAAFFLMQPVVILFERSLHVRRWTPLAARVWTITTLTLLFPLVLAPFLRALRIRL